MLIESSQLIDKPKVSVIVLVYNHAQYIKKCLDNIVNQKCSFLFEIIIGEDCSKDKSLDICKEYQKQYPDKIRLLSHEKNQGLLRNYRDLLSLCRGEYIAQCAGDDYWCSINKLEEQILFFQKNVGYGFVRTNGYVLENGILKEDTSHGFSKVVGDVKEIAIYGPVGLASSICFKRELLKYINIDDWIKHDLLFEDYLLHAILSYHTLFGFIDTPMVFYRILESGISHNKDYLKQFHYQLAYWNIRKYLKEKFPESSLDMIEIEDAIHYTKIKYLYRIHKYELQYKYSFNTKSYNKRVLVRCYQNRLSFYIISLLYNYYKR